jgi:hypothetical protein
VLQKKGVLSEAALPEDLRLALAETMQNDLFYQVRARRRNLVPGRWLR